MSSALKAIALSQDFAAAELDGLERGLKVQSSKSPISKTDIFEGVTSVSPILAA